MARPLGDPELRRSVATHEAAHAVVTVILGGRITTDISLGFDGRALGRHAFNFGDGPDATWQKAVSGVAGSEAEQIMGGESRGRQSRSASGPFQ